MTPWEGDENTIIFQIIFQALPAGKTVHANDIENTVMREYLSVQT